MKQLSSFVSLLIFSNAIAQDSLAPKGMKAYSISYLSGKVLVHNHDVQSIENAKPKGFSVDMSRHFTDSASYSHSRSYIRKGASFTFYNLGTPILGNAYILSYFIEPSYRLGNKAQVHFRADCGAGYFSNPFDSVKNPANRNYSLRITPYVHVSAGLGYHLNKHIVVAVNAHFSHMSNGNFKEPNAGLNWSALAATILYYPGSNFLPEYRKPSRYRWNENKAGLDAGVTYVPRQGYHRRWRNTRKYMTGIYLHGYKQVSRISAVNVGAELIYNKFVDAPGVPADNSKPALLPSIQIGHEFLFGKYIASQQYGRYISDYPAFFKTAYYHRWGLRYRFANNFFIGLNLKVHRFTADFIDLRLQYKLK